MDYYDLVIKMKLLESRLTLYEEKYGLSSRDFYAAYTAGELSHCNRYAEMRQDFSRWLVVFETWQRRKAAQARRLKQRQMHELIRSKPTVKSSRPPAETNPPPNRTKRSKRPARMDTEQSHLSARR